MSREGIHGMPTADPEIRGGGGRAQVGVWRSCPRESAGGGHPSCPASKVWGSAVSARVPPQKPMLFA